MSHDELIDVLVANKFGNRNHDNQFVSYRVSVGKAGDKFTLYAQTVGTQNALQRLFKDDPNVIIKFMEKVHAI